MVGIVSSKSELSQDGATRTAMGVPGRASRATGGGPRP
ncbi:hypothetical protein BURPS1106B_3052 [Burkholderia pseudomallei 1106b]|uniref:Uncharacterized protein n=1 Tax=Burkholderia pseudomallei 1710a TaxID=320371 RepID=A0A0E1VXU2_BURPE|nr:hypothetical protein BUH_6488 [Burkholderia pseudomallei Pakistan 9]EES23099.1 hypothetical protein BURPS1106B_3052 [Burkholderia pseudomallei 1106b]EET05733.1 hypothetical protein BURPS1710A_A1385 [Burkholderia pseudomallei 1710a]